MTDHDRPLSSRGREAAPRMGAWIKKTRLRPDLMLCSTAARVRETVALLRPSLPADITIQELKRLYMALPREILSEIGRVPDDVDTLMVVGHNPGIGSLAHWLAGQGDKRELIHIADKFPTAGVAVLSFEVDSWRDVEGETGTLRHFATPKDGD